MDKVSPSERSRVMSRVRSVRNRSTEWRIRAALIRSGVRGWKLNSNDLPGRPDFAFPLNRLAVFLDGCFWHGCRKCRRIPSSNTGYWDEKIKRNRARDRKVSGSLRGQGWRVIRIWEHEISRSCDRVVLKIITALNS
jgi:DNA mismatch endonuclease (patch repair protein)